MGVWLRVAVPPRAGSRCHGRGSRAALGILAMSSRLYCDGCGKGIPDHPGVNYWSCTLHGDVSMNGSGGFISPTGVRKFRDKSRSILGGAIRQADMCVECMSKIQEDNE